MDQKNIQIHKTALIVIDKQISYTIANSVISGEDVNPFDALVVKIDSFISGCREKGMKIVWTQMIEDTDKSPLNIQSKMLASGTSTISNPSAESFGFNGSSPLEGELVIVKKYYDAFAQTELARHLHDAGIETLILVGGYASRCVLGTAFGANGNDFNVIVIEDLIANPSRMISEIPSTLSIINSILGYTVLENELSF